VLIPVVIAGLLLLGYWLWLRSQELFRIQIRSGKQTVTRGYVPVGLLNDFGAAVRGVQNGEIRAHKGQGGARLSFGGDVDAGAAQRLRNIFGLYPVARLRAPNIDKRRAVSDAFTVAWFVSILRNFFR
jgi:Protein of unknown function (DUF3634)